MTEKVHIIAEAGTTHEGNLAMALHLVDVAKEIGADSVKFQFIDAPELYLTHLRENGELVENAVVAVRRGQELTKDEWREVAAKARVGGIPFSASVFGLGTLEFLDALDAPYIKLASTDTANLALIEAAATTGRRILLSTGMSGLGEVETAVEVLMRRGAHDVVLLHCVSAYPCPPEISNLAFIPALKAAFGLPVGFSDHTENSVAGIAAVALGACVIEKHLTHDRSAKGFDHAYAMEPAMFAAYIADIRMAEAALARQIPKIGATEAVVRQRARRGLWAAADLPAGQVLTEADILVVRPSGSLQPEDLPRILGRRLVRGVLRSAPLRLEDME